MELSWEFLTSEFAGDDYMNWPIERRLDAYLRHHELLDVLNTAPPTAVSWSASWPISVLRIGGASWGSAHPKRITLQRVPRRRLADH